MGGTVTGRSQCPEICDAPGWPALSSSLTSVRSKTAVKGRTGSKRPEKPNVLPVFAPPLQNPGYPSDGLYYLSFTQRRVRTEEQI